MNAVASLDDPFARVGLTVLRGTGLRVGELLDLELGSGHRLRRRRDLAAGAAGQARHRTHRPLSSRDPRSARRVDHPPRHAPAAAAPAHRRAHRLPVHRARPPPGLHPAAQRAAHRRRSASLRAPTAGVPVVTPHQLRHTYATALANAGMSLQALMALLGHVTPEMTIRYATLASPTLRDAYDQAMGKMRRQLTLTPVGRRSCPTRSPGWPARCSRPASRTATAPATNPPGACPYANICETCDNYTTAPEFRAALTDQLDDVQALRTDAETPRLDQRSRTPRPRRRTPSTTTSTASTS